MIKDRRVVAVMLMREQSLRIKDKCMKLINGVPLAKITFDKLAKCKYIDEIYVSTSSPRYKAIVAKWGALIIDRPRELSKSSVILSDVIRHAAANIPGLDDRDFIIQTEPTKPLGKTKYFNFAVEYAHARELDSCFTVKELKANLVGDMPVNSQDKPSEEKRFMQFGYVRLRTKKTTLECTGWGEGIKHINLPLIQDYEIDIDHPHQWIQAEALLKAGY